VPLGFLIETEKEIDFPPSVAVMEREFPEKVALKPLGLGGRVPSSWAWRAALISFWRHAQSSFVVTLFPLKKTKGLGSLGLDTVGNVVGTEQAWRFSATGAAKTVVAIRGRAMEYFIMNELWYWRLSEAGQHSSQSATDSYIGETSPRCTDWTLPDTRRQNFHLICSVDMEVWASRRDYSIIKATHLGKCWVLAISPQTYHGRASQALSKKFWYQNRP